ncbi:MAG: NAD-dependent deacylase [Thermoguttaceae bacterium]
MDLSADDRERIDFVVRLLSESRSLLFITGAGVSAESGLPTYRGIGGLYEGAATEEGFPIEMALSGEMLDRRPEIAWKYLAQIGRATQGKTFNRAHEVIARLESRFERVWVLTQNIDGFHRQAGSKNLIEIHGDLHEFLCTACGRREPTADFQDLPIPPRCRACGSVLRPDVVLFGETLPEAKLERLYRELDAGFDMVFSVGTTSVFPYISQPVLQAKRRGRPTVEINPGETRVSDLVDVKLSLGAAVALDAIWQRLAPEDE